MTDKQWSPRVSLNLFMDFFLNPKGQQPRGQFAVRLADEITMGHITIAA